MLDAALRPYRLVASALALVLLASPLPAMAQSTGPDPCALPRLSGDEPEGLGGTGLGPQAGLAGGGDEDDSGVGGTGFGGDEPDGLGGTGVVGTVTGFGSICVNGLRIAYDASTPTEINGEAAASASLAIGHVVAVHAASAPDDPNSLRARRIGVRHVVRGSVEHIAPNGDGRSELSLLGQRVVVETEMLAEDVVVGAEVAVSGQRRGDDRIAASRIDTVTAGKRASLIGRLVFGGTGDARVAGVSILPDGGLGTIDAALSGEHVIASGIWNPAARQLEEVGLEPAVVFERGTQGISLGGYVQQVEDAGPVRIGPFRVDLAAFEAAPRPDDYIVVRGVLAEAGLVRALRVALDVRPPRHVRPPRFQRPTIDRIRPTRPRPPAIERPPRIERPPSVDRPPRPLLKQIRPQSPL